MRNSIKRNLFKAVLILFCIVIQNLGCSQERSNKKEQRKQTDEKKGQVEIVSPRHSDVFKCGDSIEIKLNLKKKENVDSIILSSAKSENIIYRAPFLKLIYPAGDRVGQKIIKAEIFFNDNTSERLSVVVVLLSDIIPELYKYTVVNKYPHDPNAYTQGLLYSDGILFESTGQNSHSSIRRVNIKTGEVIKKIDLKPELFGEGIALYNNNLYQITWQNKIGFIYNKDNLELIRTFDYSIDQGWGLTSKGDSLFLSDGSSFLYTIEPEYFSQIDQIEVFDNKGRVSELNELEFIKGKIFANVYGDTKIIIIDYSTGKVTGIIEMKNIFPASIPRDMDHVLNGIAYNPVNNHLYVTGKLWPVLYEIKIENLF